MVSREGKILRSLYPFLCLVEFEIPQYQNIYQISVLEVCKFRTYENEYNLFDWCEIATPLKRIAIIVFNWTDSPWSTEDLRPISGRK